MYPTLYDNARQGHSCLPGRGSPHLANASTPHPLTKWEGTVMLTPVICTSIQHFLSTSSFTAKEEVGGRRCGRVS